MSNNYWKPKYTFKVFDYDSNWTTPPTSNPKYLYVEIYDKNKDNEDNYTTTHFVSLKNLYFRREGKSIIIGNKQKEININHYDMDQADENYQKLKQLLNLPF